MGASVKCSNCNFQGRYDSSEIINIGTSFVPQFEVYCHNCKSPIISEEIVESIKPQYLLSKKTQGELISEIASLLSQKKLPEIILQDYLKKEYKQYGFTDIEGPFNKGPDFKVILGGKCKWLEVETDADNYKKHGHHLSRNFDKVELLFYLYDYKDDSKSQYILPQAHIKTDIIHFKEWFYKRINRKDYVQNILERFNAIYNEYARIYLNEFCDKRDSDMNICPNCSSCAYNNEEWIIDYTDKFLKINSEIIHSERFDFNKITSKKLHEVFD